jgi:phage-related protein
MATEIASAYVSLIPSFKGGKAAISKEMQGPIEDASEDAGSSGGKKSAGAFSGAFGALAKGAGILGGLSLLKDSFSLALTTANLPGQLQQQFGLTAPYAKEAADTAGKLYAQGFGDSLSEVGKDVGTVAQALNTLGDSSDIANTTKQAEGLAKTFGLEVGPLINSASQLVKTGLSPNMSSAFDTITKGFQNAGPAGEDFLDTITEYSVQFQKLGLDATTSTGLLKQGLDAGARSTDLVADALKEFSIRAVDGSATTKAGFQGLGLSATDMAAKFAAGGESSKAALQLTLDKLEKMAPSAQRSQLAVDLFGTQAEDLGSALFALNPATVAATGGMSNVAGAADKVASQAGPSLSNQMDVLSRTFQTGLAGALTAVLPLIQGFLNIIQPLMPFLGPIAIAIGAITAAQWLWNAAMDANPIGLIIGLVAGLVIGFIALWNKSADFRDFFIGIWHGIQAVVGAVVGWVVDRWNTWIAGIKLDASTVGTIIGAAWHGIQAVVGAVVGWVVDRWQGLVSAIRTGVDAIKSVWNGVGDFIKAVWDGIPGAVKAAINSIIGIVNGAIGGINAATGLVGIPAIPKIPRLAKGGIVNSATLAVIGEAGPEAVVPLSGSNSPLGNATGNDAPIYVNVQIGDDDINALVDTRITRNNRIVKRAVTQGTGMPL